MKRRKREIPWETVWNIWNPIRTVTGRFAPSSVRPWTFRPQDVSPPGRIQRFLVTRHFIFYYC